MNKPIELIDDDSPEGRRLAECAAIVGKLTAMGYTGAQIIAAMECRERSLQVNIEPAGTDAYAARSAVDEAGDLKEGT